MWFFQYSFPKILFLVIDTILNFGEIYPLSTTCYAGSVDGSTYSTKSVVFLLELNYLMGEPAYR